LTLASEASLEQARRAGESQEQAFDLAYRLAAGEDIRAELDALADAQLIRGLRRLDELRKRWQTDAPDNGGQIEPGPRWGHLERLQLAGSGSFGEVFRAFDPSLNRNVALKLKRNDGNGELFGGSRDFIAEAQRLARVRHPHVLAVHGASMHANRAGIWADWIDGATLHERLICGKRLTLDQVFVLAGELLGAVSAVHDAGIVHGDIKASNVMLDQRGHSVLMDFGAGFSSSEGEVKQFVGTPQYLAPEAVAGLAVSSAVDIYALGVLLHLAATSEFPNISACDRLGANTPGKFEPIVAKLHKFGGVLNRAKQLRRFIATMLIADPRHRPDAKALQHQLKVILEQPLQRAKQRVRWAIFGALLLVSVVSSVGFWRVYQENARAVAAREYLLEVLRFSNPYQSNRPTQRVDELFENAVSIIDQRLANDLETQARVLNQFGRSLLMLDREEISIQALERADQILARQGFGLTEDERMSVSTNLVDVYSRQRQFSRALLLSQARVAPCRRKLSLPADTCLGLLNSNAETLGIAGQYRAAIAQAQSAAKFAIDHGLEMQYGYAYSFYLRGMFSRELGRSKSAAADYQELTQRTLTGVPATHPGLLTDLMLMAWSASDYGNIALAQELNRAAVKGRTELFGANARLSLHTRLQEGILSLQQGDRSLAQSIFQKILAELSNTASRQQFREDASVWLAITAPKEVSDQQLKAVEASRLQAFGNANPRRTEFQLRLVWAWLARGDLARAQQVFVSAQQHLDEKDAEGLQAPALLLRLEFANRQGDIPSADRAQGALNKLLGREGRRLFQPLRLSFTGPIVDANGAESAKIRKLYEAVLARRRSVSAPGS